jgi:hypothetical protein
MSGERSAAQTERIGPRGAISTHRAPGASRDRGLCDVRPERDQGNDTQRRRCPDDRRAAAVGRAARLTLAQ